MNITDKIEIVNGRFKIIKQIGAGTFGDIYLGLNLKTEELVSLKVEDGVKYPGESQLKKEGKFLANLAGGEGIPGCTGLALKMTGIFSSLTI